MINPLQFESFNDTSSASTFVQDSGKGFSYIAGGTDLIVQARSGKIRPKCIVDVSNCLDLVGIKEDDQDRIEIGALTTIEDLLRSPVVQRKLPALFEAANVFAAWQVRNVATLGGNLCNASPAADTVPPLLVYSATVRASIGTNEREIPLETFFMGPGRTSLEQGELLTRIIVPKVEGGSAFFKLGKRQSSILAVVNAAALLKTEGMRIVTARVALGSVAPTPIRAPSVERFLEGKQLTDDNLREAAKLVQGDIKPISDVRAGANYRKEMSVVFTRKALELAARRSVGSVLFK